MAAVRCTPISVTRCSGSSAARSSCGSATSAGCALRATLRLFHPNVLHGFQVVQDTLMEVVAEYDIGTLFPVRQPDGSRRLVEVYRADLPWCAPPPRPGQYTTDEALQEIIRSVDIQV